MAEWTLSNKEIDGVEACRILLYWINTESCWGPSAGEMAWRDQQRERERERDCRLIETNPDLPPSLLPQTTAVHCTIAMYPTNYASIALLLFGRDETWE